MTVAADPDPYFALPKLYGGPAYARPPKVVPQSERPFDPDDMPIAAAMTEDERACAGLLSASGPYRSSGNGADGAALVAGGAAGATRGAAGGAAGATDPGARRFSLRALTDLLGPRSK